jgi:hypothetical protein
MKPSPRQAALVAVGAGSLVLDGVAARGVQALGIWDGYARLFLASLLVSLVLYLASGPGDSFRLPRWTLDGEAVRRRERIWMPAIWIGVALLGTCAMVGLGRPGSVVDAVGFLVTHPLAQVLLFQGALVQLAGGSSVAGTAPSRRDLPFGPLLVVAALQGLSQLQYFASLSWSAGGQVLRGFFLGLLLCALRVYFGSLWPALALYAINGGLALYGGRPLGFHF